MNLRKVIRNILSESIVDESAFRTESLPKDTGLFVRNINQGYDLVIYDPHTKNAYGIITIAHREYYGEDYFVSGVAAERGFGPFTYELAMMHIQKEGKGLMPTRDGDVRGGAWNVWKYFYKNRTDVEKRTLEINNPYFKFNIITGDDVSFEDEEDFNEYISELTNEEKFTLNVFNTVYSLKPNKQYFELIKKANEWIKNGFDKEIAMKAGDELWQEKYD